MGIRDWFRSKKKQQEAPSAPASSVSNDRIEILEEKGNLVKHKCGHTAPPKIRACCYGSVIVSEEEVADNCGPCRIEILKRVAVRCGNCGFAILPGNPVAKYADGPYLKRPWSRVVLPDGGVIGCLRGNCCPSGGFYVGTWNGENVVLAFPEGRTQAEEVMATGDTIMTTETPDGMRTKRLKRS